MAKEKILVVDDEAGVRFGIGDFLESQGYEVGEADSCQGMLDIFRTSRPDAAIVDYMLPDGHALDLLPRLRDIDPTVPLILLTAHGSIDLAVRAVKEGAEHFLTKPVELSALLAILDVPWRIGATARGSSPVSLARLARRWIRFSAPVRRSASWPNRSGMFW